MRLIDAEVFEELFHKQIKYGATDIFDAVEDALQDTPDVDAVPVVHARWIDEIEPNAVTSSGREVHFYRCSACDFQWNNKTAVFHYFKFCPNCGARMDGESEEEG